MNRKQIPITHLQPASTRQEELSLPLTARINYLHGLTRVQL